MRSESALVTEPQIKADLAAIAPYTQHIRTYSATNGIEQVPALASVYGLRVTQGIWINEWEAQNEKEIESAHRALQALPQHRQPHRRQRDDLPRAG